MDFALKYLPLFRIDSALRARSWVSGGRFNGFRLTLWQVWSARSGDDPGTARVALGLHEIGRIKHGDIMVVNSTDPGWTTVFSVISGIVLETGGMTAHGAMLAREYGLPAVQVPNATRLIADGAHIEINGDTGLVILPEIDGTEGRDE
jgi:rifampicin phosphotransferase